MAFEQFVGTRPVAPQHAFDEAALARWMQGRVEGFDGTLHVEQFKGGQSNPTFLLTSGAHRYVLRRKPPGNLLPSAHAVDREFRVISALRDTDVPVARAHALCEDPAVIGTMFYVMDYVEGRVLWDPGLPGMSPDERRAHYAELGRVIAALHRVDPAAVGLAEYGKPGNQGLFTLRQGVALWVRNAAGKAQTAAGLHTRRGFATPHAAFLATTLREGLSEKATRRCIACPHVSAGGATRLDWPSRTGLRDPLP